jgi:hypothetical protein
MPRLDQRGSIRSKGSGLNGIVVSKRFGLRPLGRESRRDVLSCVVSESFFFTMSWCHPQRFCVRCVRTSPTPIAVGTAEKSDTQLSANCARGLGRGRRDAGKAFDQPKVGPERLHGGRSVGKRVMEHGQPFFTVPHTQSLARRLRRLRTPRANVSYVEGLRAMRERNEFRSTPQAEL